MVVLQVQFIAGILHGVQSLYTQCPFPRGIQWAGLIYPMTLLAFFLNFIPNVGSIVATVMPLPVALIQYDTMGPVVAAVALPGLVQLSIGNGLEPVLMGRGLDLHPLVVLMALLFWGLLWGVAGMFLAAPLTAIIRLVLERFETTRPMAS